MMLYKPIVSLFMLIAATSGVAASATPVRRGGGYSPLAPITPSECTASQQCCATVVSGIGEGCTSVNFLLGGTCQNNAVCCENDNVHQNGFININCIPIVAAL